MLEMTTYEKHQRFDGSVPVYSWTRGVPFAENAKQQLLNTASLPIVFHHVAAMPDVHLGIGATVGSVVATLSAVIPAAVGVDIGCGMAAVKTNLNANDLPDSLSDLRTALEASIPVGGPGIQGTWAEEGRYGTPASVSRAWNARLAERYQVLVEKHPEVKGKAQSTQLCTLGGGNHFIEICLDTEDAVWVMLHTGSRGPGNKIGQYFIEKAREDMRIHQVNLPDKDLAYLKEGTKYYEDYIEALTWAQDFARINRDLMMDRVLTVMTDVLDIVIQPLGKAVNCHHNYVAKEIHYGTKVFVTRKGAVKAGVGDLGIIPGSMGAKSFIVRGLGNPESFNSCSHGAGRVLSRGEAKRTLTLEDFSLDTAGVECRKDIGVIDEAPRAYKQIESVMEAQKDLVDVVATLKGVLCIKG